MSRYRRHARLAKRAIDLLASSSSLLLLAPALVSVGVAVRLDSSGPALFSQDRVGRNGRVFRLYKFRTMTSGAPVQFNADGSTAVGKADARITRAGRYLRGALDELPQLLNVLRGEMSLVGPRPDMPIHAAAYTERERHKLTVRPGMTSLAAVLGRNDINWKQRIAIDLDYIDKWSLLLDLRVIAATLALAAGKRPFDFSDITDYQPAKKKPPT